MLGVLLPSWSIVIRVNIPKHLLFPNRYLPFGMLITRLFKQLNFYLSAERSIELSININSTLLKRMRARKRAPAPQPPPIILLLTLDTLQPHQPLLTLTQLSLLSFLSMIWRCQQILKRLSTEFRTTCNTSTHLFDIPRDASMRPIVRTLGLFHFQEAMRSPFHHRVLRLTPRYLLQLLLRHQLLLKIQTFRMSDPFSVNDKKGERDLEILWSYLGVFHFHVFIYVLFYLDM